MNNSENKKPTVGNAAHRPSLMGHAADPSAAPDMRAGQSSTRVLADLGGQKSSTSFKGTAAALISGAVVVAAGSVYWASRSSAPAALATAPHLNAAPTVATATVPPAPESPKAAPVVLAAATAASPLAVPEAGAARIISDESNIARSSKPLAAVMPTPAMMPSKARPAGASGAPARSLSAESDPFREKSRPYVKTATVAKDGPKAAAPATKERTAAPSRLARATPAHVASKRADADTDTDLLAAMLRRSGGNQSPSQ